MITAGIPEFDIDICRFPIDIQIGKLEFHDSNALGWFWSPWFINIDGLSYEVCYLCFTTLENQITLEIKARQDLNSK